MPTTKQTDHQIPTASGGVVHVVVWYGRHTAPYSGTRHRGWWWASDDCDRSGPYATEAEAEAEARELVSTF